MLINERRRYKLTLQNKLIRQLRKYLNFGQSSDLKACIND